VRRRYLIFAEDHWPRKWAEAYVAFATGEKRAWLYAHGLRFFPVVGSAERGGYGAIGHCRAGVAEYRTVSRDAGPSRHAIPSDAE
jgi:predicted oxidoreductase